MDKNIIAVNIGKAVALGLKVFHLGSGTSMPGIFAKKISPNILSDLVKQTKREIIAITGTNGKTTSANFIYSILNKADRKVCHNAKGANMLTGVITASIESANNFGKFDIDNCVFESDEAYLQKFADYFNADFLVVTNLFRDQLDRYGELDKTAQLIKNAIEKFKNKKGFTLILNADDPTILSLVSDNTIFFGFDKITFSEEISQKHSSKAEVAVCKCGKDFKYKELFYGHIGHYYCDCGVKRQIPFVKATAEIFVEKSIIHINDEKYNFDVTVNMPGIYNAYNALCAIVTTLKMGIDPKIIQEAFNDYETVFGRAEKLNIKGKEVLIQLIKNPVGAGEVLETVNADKNARILIAINDDYADGRDVSWLWDANFEILKNYNKQIVVSGTRAADMAVRLKYAGIDKKNIFIIDDLKKSIEYSIKQTEETEKLYIMPTYTALLNMQKFLKK